MKQQKDINLEVILNYNGIVQEQQKKINQLFYFHLIIGKNTMQKIIMNLFPVIQIVVHGLDTAIQKSIYIKP